MHEGLVVAGTNHRQVVHKPGYIGEQVRDFNARLPELRELAPRGQQRRVRGIGELQPDVLQAGRQALPVEFQQRRLGIESVDVAGAAVHEEINHALRLRRELRRLGSQGIRNIRGRCQEAFLLHEPAQRQQAETAACAGQKLPPGAVTRLVVPGLRLRFGLFNRDWFNRHRFNRHR